MPFPTVDLPQPDSPTSDSVSPRLMSKVTPSTAWTLAVTCPRNPPWMGKCFLSPFTSSSGRSLFMLSHLGVSSPALKVCHHRTWSGDPRLWHCQPAMLSVGSCRDPHPALGFAPLRHRLPGVVTGHAVTDRLGFDRRRNGATQIGHHRAAPGEGAADDRLAQTGHQTGDLRQLAAATLPKRRSQFRHRPEQAPRVRVHRMREDLID